MVESTFIIEIRSRRGGACLHPSPRASLRGSTGRPVVRPYACSNLF